MVKRRSLTKARVLGNARNLVEKPGVQQLAFQNLAVDLGTKYPSLCNHFENTVKVENALANLLIQELNDALQRASVGKSDAEATRIYAETYQQFALENSAIYELLISVPETQNQRLIEGVHEASQIILQLLTFRPFSNEERLHRSQELHSLIHGYITLRSLSYFQREEATPKESYRRIIEDFIASLEVAG